MLSEAAMMHIATVLGKTAAHDVAYKAAMEAWESGRPLRDILMESDEVKGSGVDLDRLAELLVPESYLGSCQVLVDRVVTGARTFLAGTGLQAEAEVEVEQGGAA
jgi:adenylosuccinate lyase